MIDGCASLGSNMYCDMPMRVTCQFACSGRVAPVNVRWHCFASPSVACMVRGVVWMERAPATCSLWCALW